MSRQAEVVVVVVVVVGRRNLQRGVSHARIRDLFSGVDIEEQIPIVSRGNEMKRYYINEILIYSQGKEIFVRIERTNVNNPKNREKEQTSSSNCEHDVLSLGKQRKTSSV